VRAARMAAERGARTAIAEESTFGGTCVNLGCIPKKFFVYACAFPEEFEDADWDTYYALYSKLMTGFLPKAHQLQCPEG
jgi:pyruvate/2-oxoglutarate dehydrogenase complex dihydrolipoamide dehydrogenase (E3) component